MYKNTIALILSLLTAPALTPAAMAQGAPPAITEAEAHAIAVPGSMLVNCRRVISMVTNE
jgi:hypothetical protein